MRSKRQKPAKGKVSRRDFKRDPAFRDFLLKELDMETAPASYHQALGRMYAELPRDMPVRHYPGRTAIRRLSAVAALVLVVGVSLFGANRAYPQLTESLPGVGSFFRSLNGTGDTLPDPPPLAKTGTGKKQGGQNTAHTMPAFGPIEAENPHGFGRLTVDSAWSDGKNLYLDMSLWAPADTLGVALSESLNLGYGVDAAPALPNALEFLQEKEVRESSSVPEEAAAGEHAFSQVLINGREAVSIKTVSASGEQYAHGFPDCLALLWQGNEQREESGKMELYAHYGATWVLEVPIRPASDQSLSVDLGLYSVWASNPPSDYYAAELPITFAATFDVPIDEEGTVTVDGPAEDNGYTLENVACTPGQLDATITVPFSGYYGYSLLPLEYSSNPPRNKPYGMYAKLTGEDGSTLREYSIWDGSEPLDTPDGCLQLPFSALLEPQNRERLTLTLYRFDPEDLKQWAAYFPGIEEDTLVNPVMAEFTIDLSACTAVPSENYKEAGLTKLSLDDSLLNPNHPRFENGLYVQSIDEAADSSGRRAWLISLLVEEDRLSGVGSWELSCISQGQWVQTVPACDVTGDSAYNATLPDDPGVSVFETESGRFWRMERGQSSYEDGGYAHLFFLVTQPDWMTQDRLTFEQLQLIEAGSSEVLIENMWDSFRNNLTTVLTGGLYKGLGTASQPASGQ